MEPAIAATMHLGIGWREKAMRGPDGQGLRAAAREGLKLALSF
ncbi:MAG: hypothetical protein AAGE83_06065 [Pseudomonadota bacterium]